MKKYFLLILICVTQSALGCSCLDLDSNDIDVEISKSDLIIRGKVLDVQEYIIWSDTLFASSLYDSTAGKSYSEFKKELFGISMKEYTVLIDSSFKKPDCVKDTVRIISGLGGGDCGYKFETNETYLIYAVKEYSVEYTLPKLGRSFSELQGLYRTNICTRTGLVHDRSFDLEYLEKFRRK